jgi:hypothetical protein
MSDQYNCFAWSVGIDSQILMADRDYSEAEFDAFYDSHNYIPCGRDEAEILLYKDATNIKHAARKKDGCTCGSGKWIMFESKLGPLTRIEHRRDQINGGTYGNHYRYYKKR